MNYSLPDIRKAEVKGKRVFVRADLDAPLSEDGKILDDTRLKAGVPTIEYLLKNGATVIIAGKLGRPTGENYESRSKNQELSLRLVAQWFTERFMIHDSPFMIQKSKIGEFDGWKLSDKLFILENLRFYPEEEKNDAKFAKKLASPTDIYVNEAFAMCHRNNASVVAITRFLPHFAGIRLQQEVEELTRIFENPKRPLVVIIGGKKIETKLPLVTKMDRTADYVLVGGKIAEEREVFSKLTHTLVADLTASGLDINLESVEHFLKIIQTAKTIIWNGPMGLISEKLEEDTEKGTRMLVEGIISSGAYTIAGGGDTIEFLNKVKLFNQIDFVSMGGGAMLAFLSGQKLPGLKALK